MCRSGDNTVPPPCQCERPSLPFIALLGKMARVRMLKKSGQLRTRVANFWSILLDDKESAWAFICTLIASRESAAT
jgi:hypothetical protein